MNLYRSFGNLMEAWVTEGGQCSDSEWFENNNEDSPMPSPDMETNLRSESVDSGVETASSDASFLATTGSISTDNAEIEPFTPEREGLSPASSSQSPVFSSPLPSSPSRAQEGAAALHQKLEQALQRTDSTKDKSESLTVERALQRTDSKNQKPLIVDEVLRRQPRASILPKWHASGFVRGYRSESFGPRRTVNPPASMMCRRPVSLRLDKQPAQTRLEDLGEEDRKELSPGLCYLEEVCQMLEEIAKQRLHNQALQMETNALQEHQDMEAHHDCQSDFKAAEEEDLSSCPASENTESAEQSSSEPQQQQEYSRGHFRRRSASDTALTTLHLRKLKDADCRGQHLSTDDLLERVDEGHETEELKKEETTKTNKIWRFKIGSLRRDGSSVSDMKGQQMQSSERSSARRRLSQLFRRNRRKTLPV